MKAIDFGTPAKLNWDVLVAERERHETEEAKSAVTYCYKQAEAEDLINAVTNSLRDDASKIQPTEKNVETDVAKSRSMKASVVTEITRVISATLTSTAKPNTTGLERRVRWHGLGIFAEDDAIDDALATDVNTSTNSARSIYNSLSRRLPLPFMDAGICFHPLILGSWVLVGFKDQVWLGNGKQISISAESIILQFLC
jgi:hypothetical protein